MSDDSGTPPSADEAAQQEADRIDAAVDALEAADVAVHHAIDALERADAAKSEIIADEPVKHDAIGAGIIPLPLGQEVTRKADDHTFADANADIAATYAQMPEMEPSVVGHITPAEEPVEEFPMPVLPATDVPFPHDVDAVHAVDGLAEGSVLTKTSRFGYSLVDENGKKIDGYPITGAGDALAHLPVGASAEVGVNQQVVVILPASDSRRMVATVGQNFHHAVHQLWGWLVTEGHAVVS